MNTRLTCGVAFVVACLATGVAVSAQDAPVLVVAPFSPIGSQADLDWIGVGTAETVGTDLRAAGGVDVVGRALVDGALANRGGAGRGRAAESALIAGARELGADLLLAGAFQQLGERLRLTARLIDVRSETAVESFKVDGRRDTLFELQDRLADEVRAALRSRSGRPAPRARPAFAGSPSGTAPRAAAPRARPTVDDTAAAETAGNGAPTRAEVAPTRAENGDGAGDALPSGRGHGPTRAENGDGDGAWLPAGRRPGGPYAPRRPAAGAGTAGALASGELTLGGPPADRPARAASTQRRDPAGGVSGGPPADRPARAASTQPPSRAGFAVSSRRSVQARRTAEPPAIDGRLDDAVWRGAALVTDFVQTSPVEGAAPTERTEVWIAYDADHLYFAFHAHYTNPDEMRANRVDRDQIRRDDWIAVMFDTFLDQQRAYRFSVNAYGVQGDAILQGGRSMRGPPGGGGDSSWDALFHTGGARVADGWTAEMAIPFKSLRYPARGAGEHRWGFQITRTMQTRDETVVWSPMTRAVAGTLNQMGVIGGLRGLSQSRNLEFLPTATGIQLGQLTDAGYVEGAAQPDLGLNVKYGLTSNLTADFALNPDFSQIESDRPQIETNQRYPLFFPELRPFFLEGQEIFDTPGRTNLVHTRTIVDPQVGGKLTGKAGAATLGVLYANDEAPGKFDDPHAYGFGQTADFFIGRARYDVYAESYVGAIVTDREFLDSYSRVAGVDGRFRIGRNHSAEFLAVASAHRDLDGRFHSGPAYDVRFRRDARRLSYRFDFNSIDPDFRTDAGFVRRVDTQRFDADVEYDWWPESWIISWGPSFRYSRNVDHAGVLQDEDFRGDVNVRFARNVFFRADGRRELERFEGVDFHKTRFSMRNGISSSRRFSLFYGVDWGQQIRFVENPFLGRMFDYNVSLTLLPTSRLNTRFSLDTARFRDVRTDALVFDVKILRAFTTYQFTDRLLARNILEHDTGAGKVGINLLFTYRVNAGTALYVGYDDRLQEGVLLDRERFYTRDLQRQRRAFFTKFQYLFRY